jgi:hypothetical protein
MIKNLLARLSRKSSEDPGVRVRERKIPEISDDEIAIIDRHKKLTMTNIDRQWALISAVKYLNRGNIEGAIVECGVWRGGNMLIAKELCRGAGVERDVVLFDTFTGMSEPTIADVSREGLSADVLFRQHQQEDHVDWCYASLEEVRGNFEKAGLLDQRVKFVKGKVEDTLRDERNCPETIGLLRLDTDFYESTKTELEILYPRLVRGGVLIVDDYGYWQGAQKAVDEYFAGRNPLMIRIDYSARMMIKQD